MHLCTYAPMHPLHPCTPAPLHPCTSAPLHLCTPAPLHLCTPAPLHLCPGILSPGAAGALQVVGVVGPPSS